VVRLTYAEPRDGERLEHLVEESLAVRAPTAKLYDIDSAPSPRLAYLRIDGRTRNAHGAGHEVMSLARGLGVDVGVRAEVIYWDARRRGPLRLRRRLLMQSFSGGDPGTGGPGTAGVREPRRPYPPGFPPMQAALDPPVR